jgi:EAL domain-containing protein (putative c-di-GMP-specific phosphodiesterase class I)
MDRQTSRIQTGIAVTVILALSVLFVQLSLQFRYSVQHLNTDKTESFDLTFSHLTNTALTEFEEIVQTPFVEAPMNEVPVGFGQHNHWYHIYLYNHTNEVAHLRLLIDNPIIDSITLFHPDPRFDEVQIAHFGDQKDNLSINQRVLPNYAFELVPGQTKNLWVHVENNGAPIIALSVLEEVNYEKYARLLHILWGAFIGLALVLSIYNAVLYLGLRDVAYLHYIAYLIAILILMGVIHGFGYYLFPEDVQRFFSDRIISVQTLVALCALNFGKHFLGISKKQTFAYRFVKINFYCILTLLIFSLFTKESIAAPVFSLVQACSYFSVVVMIRYKFVERIRWTRYYLISWIPFFIGAAVGLLLFIGTIEYTMVLRHVFLASIILEMTLISMALANRMGESDRIRLFQTTHDVKTRLANEYFIKEKLNRIALQPVNKNLALIAIRMSNYEQVVPYLSEENKRILLNTMALDFTNSLGGYGRVLYLDHRKSVKTSLINNNTFTFLVLLNKQTTLIEALARLSNKDNFNPLQDQIPFRVQCVFSGRVLDQPTVPAIDLLNSVNQCVNLAISTQQPFKTYNESIDIDGARAIQLAQDLEHAIDRNELELYHQPQLHLGLSKHLYSEVLARWNHKSLGSISPNEFIVIAEQTGLIKKLTQWVISTTFSHFSNLEKTYPNRVHLSMNVSAIDLSRKEFALEVIQAGNQLKVNPIKITIEVTETSHLQDQIAFKTNVIHLKRAGYRLAIDDFGTGYSSLTYISSLPFDELKIDRIFVKDMLQTERQLQIVRTTIQMARNLGLSVTAEGIEDESTLRQLKKLQCNKIQGFHHAKPMSFEHYLRWLSEQSQASFS